jgi:hypothetical protein
LSGLRGNGDFSSNKFSPKLEKPTNSKFSLDNYYILTNNTVIHLRIDVPNSFPWRKFLHEYNGMMYTYSCSLNSYKQALTVRTLEQGDGTRFRLILGSGDGARCVEPDSLQGQGDGRMVVRVLSDCSASGVWRWSHDALLEWSGGGCLASLNGQDRTVIAPCDKNNDDQIVEFGVVATEGKEATLSPIDLELWTKRMD